MPSSDDLIRTIEETSRRNRSDCRDFVQGFFEMHVVDRNTEEVEDEWRALVSTFPWFADDVLHCLAHLLSEADEVLPDIVMYAAAQATAPDSDAIDAGAAREWLSGLRGRFQRLQDVLSQ